MTAVTQQKQQRYQMNEDIMHINKAILSMCLDKLICVKERLLTRMLLRGLTKRIRNFSKKISKPNVRVI